MRTYIVFVTFKVPGPAGSYDHVRYVDSQWASATHAEERKCELSGSLKMGQARYYEIEIIRGTIADAAISEAVHSDAGTPTSLNPQTERSEEAGKGRS